MNRDVNVVARCALIGLLYAATAFATRWLALPPEPASPLWPAAGFAFAGLLMFGPRVWPGLWLGAFIFRLTSGFSPAGAVLSAIIATGITLQAIVGARLVRRFFDVPLPLAREEDLFRVMVFAGPVACLSSASIGIAALVLAQRMPPAEIGPEWLAWWAGDAVGVLLFAPLMLLAWPKLRALRALGVTRIAVPLLVTAALLAIGHTAFDRLEETQARVLANNEMESAYDAGMVPLSQHLRALGLVAQVFASDRLVTPREFATIGRQVLSLPGVQGIGWVPRVTPEMRPAFEAHAVPNGDSHRQITERGPDGHLVPAAVRGEYFPVRYVEPSTGNSLVQGFDLASNPARRRALERARDSGAAAATTLVHLVQTGHPGLLLFVPVYADHLVAATASVAQRRAALLGFIVGALDSTQLLSRFAAIAGTRSALFRVTYLATEEVPAALASTLPLDATTLWSREVGFADGLIRTELQPSTPWRHGTSVQAQAAYFASVVAALLIALATLGTAGRTAVTGRVVAQRTAELRRELNRRREAEASLRVSQLDLATTLHSIGDAVLCTDASGCIARMNAVAEQLTGWSSAAALGRPIDEVFRIIDEETRCPAVVPIARVLQSSAIEGLTNHTVLIARDGSERSIAGSAAPIRDAAGPVRGVILVFRDVSTRRNAERALEASEARYRHLIEISPSGIFVECDGRFVFTNPRLREMVGAQTEAEIIGRQVVDFVRRSSRDVVAERMQQLRNGTAAAPREVEWTRLDGSGLQAESTAVPYQHQGRAAALVLLQDITARKRAQSQLDGFFELSLDLLGVAGTDGFFKRVSPAFTEILGWSERELLAAPLLEIVHPDDRLATRHGISQLAVRGSSLHIENRCRCKDGSWRWLAWNMMGQGGGVFYATARDVTAELALRGELERARQDAESASRAKSAFLATMSHEIRTPMNGVVGMLEILAHTPLSERQLESVATIRESSAKLLGIVDDILDFSKIEAGRMELERTPVSLCDLVEAVCTTLSTVAASKGVKLGVFVAPGLPPAVLSDEVRLRQVLYNIIGNAIKFSGREAPHRGHVTVRAEVAQPAPLRIAFQVTDDGIGMTKEAVDAVFQPFTQAESSTTRRFGGSGLGLTICRRLVEMFGGDIVVESTPGEGSTFTVTLPFEEATGQIERTSTDLSGVVCVLEQMPRFDADVVRAYVAYAGGTARFAGGGEATASTDETVVRIASGDAPPDDMATTGSGGDRTPTVLIASPGSTSASDEHTVVLEGGVIRRDALLRAIAVAAGRMSPVIPPHKPSPAGAGEVKLPSVAEARARRQLILVAEDDEVNRRVILNQLTLLGYAADIATSGTEALQMWRNGDYGLVLTDLHMPEMDGYELARSIRQQPAGSRQVSIVALTANALGREAARARACGIDDYLTKPVPLARLGDALARWLPSARQQETSRSQAGSLADDRRATVVDIGILKGLVGDDDALVDEVLRDYIATALETVAPQLTAAVSAGDVRRIGELAHKLKSSSRSIGALALGDLCQEIESASAASAAVPTDRQQQGLRFMLAEVRSAIGRILAEGTRVDG